MGKKFKIATRIFVLGIVLITLLGVILDFSSDNLINFLIPFGIGFMLSGFVGDIIENLTGDFFKDKYLSFPICKFRVNIPITLILTLIIKKWWFG